MEEAAISWPTSTGCTGGVCTDCCGSTNLRDGSATKGVLPNFSISSSQEVPSAQHWAEAGKNNQQVFLPSQKASWGVDECLDSAGMMKHSTRPRRTLAEAIQEYATGAFSGRIIFCPGALPQEGGRTSSMGSVMARKSSR